MAQLKVLNSNSPGSFGLNTELPPGQLPMEFGRTAYNCVIGNDGRLTSRKGFVAFEGDSGTPPAANVKSLYETVRQDGESNLVVGAGVTVKQLKLDTLAWVDMTPASPPTDGKWQFQSYNDRLLGTQVGHIPCAWTLNVSNEWVNAPYTGPLGLTTETFSVCHAAFGRMWIANSQSVKDTLYGSDLLNPHDFQAGDAGSIDMNLMWANGQDEVVAITSHSGYLIVLGKKQVVLLQAPDDYAITGFVLVEVLKNVGCVARDSVCHIGDDVCWAAPQGIVSLGRLLQQKALPMGNLSRNVHFDFLDSMRDSGYALKSAFHTNGEDLIITNETTGAWCFNTRRPTENGAAVATRWDQLPTTFFCVTNMRDGTLLFGGEAGAIYEYTGYGDTTNQYLMRFYSGYLDFGDPSTLKMLKKFAFVMKGAAAQSITFKWAFDYRSNYNGATDTIGEGQVSYEYGVGEYGEAEYAGGEQVEEMRVNANRSGKLLQIGVEANIKGDPVSLYTVSIYVTGGKTF